MNATINEAALCEQLCAQVKLHQRPNGMVMLETPFTFPDGDKYALHLTQLNTGGLRLSDGGTTLIQLSYETEPNKFFEGTRHVLFEQVVKEQGVSYEEKTGQFYIETSEAELAQAVFRLGQTITRIYDLTFLNRSRVVSTFYQDLKEQLVSFMPEIVLKESYVLPELIDGQNYPVDFFIARENSSPIFLFGIPSTDKARLTTIYLQHYLQHRLDFESVLVFNNQEEISRQDLSRLTNLGGEQVASLNAAEDLRRKLTKKLALPS